jgi:hypothetical protein
MSTETKTPADAGRLDGAVGRPVPEQNDMGTLLTPEQRARLISGGPNAGRVRRAGCYECAWGKVAGCWRCGSR